MNPAACQVTETGTTRPSEERRAAAVVELGGLEPPTYSLRTSRATTCAIAPGKPRSRVSPGFSLVGRAPGLLGGRRHARQLDVLALDMARGPGARLGEIDGAHSAAGARLRDVRRDGDRQRVPDQLAGGGDRRSGDDELLVECVDLERRGLH